MSEHQPAFVPPFVPKARQENISRLPDRRGILFHGGAPGPIGNIIVAVRVGDAKRFTTDNSNTPDIVARCTMPQLA